jgi:organic hydroperoxide reductase OsmC/OhrA
MSEHKAAIQWTRATGDFSYDSYSRDHTWTFPNGVSIGASAAPDYQGNPERVDPEEALVAAVAGCHMLTFLAIAARKRLVVDRYEDEATGVLEKNAEGKMAVTRITLRPRVQFGGTGGPDPTEVKRLHGLAHEHCFIANSIRTSVTVEPAE